MHVIENSLVDWFLGDAVLPPLVGASAAKWMLLGLGESLHTGLQVALQKRLIHK